MPQPLITFQGQLLPNTQCTPDLFQPFDSCTAQDAGNAVDVAKSNGGQRRSPRFLLWTDDGPTKNWVPSSFGASSNVATKRYDGASPPGSGRSHPCSLLNSPPYAQDHEDSKNSTTILAIAAAILSSDADASKEFVALIPNGGNVAGASAIGHSDNTGRSSATNAFGKAFADAGKSWTLSLCQADTDGDGQTNGQELGDPCCEWTQGAQPRWTSGVSHLSDATKTSNESLWAKIDCSNVTTIAASSAASPATGTASMVAFAALGVAAMLNLV